MASLRAKLVLGLGLILLGPVLVGACSPEARRVRDGGRGADPGNRPLVEAPYVDPKAADTTLWPGRAPAPVDRFEAGTMYPPHPPVSLGPTPPAKPPTKHEQRAFEDSAPDPPRQERRNR